MDGQTWEGQAWYMQSGPETRPERERHRPLPVSQAALELLCGVVIVPVTDEPHGEGVAN